MSKKPTLYIFCGLPGSGKTTLGKKLEKERQAVRLCPDEWMANLGMDMFDMEFRDKLEKALWIFGEKQLSLGKDVILENGLWSRQERKEKRRDAARLGVSTEMHYFDIPLEHLKKRLVVRNSSLDHGICPITEAQIEEYWKKFQKPSKNELSKYDRSFVHDHLADHRE